MDAKILPKEAERELFYRIALSFAPGIGSKTISTLLAYFGTAENIFNAPLKTLIRISGIGMRRADGLRDPSILHAAEKEMHYIRENRIQILLPEDDRFPYRLKACGDAPSLLYYRGTADLNAPAAIAVVGTRNHTDYGREITEELLHQLRSREGLLIVSGLAKGIDTIAHHAAINNQLPTVGVLAHGLDRIYPFFNKKLASEMISAGGLLTEFPSGTRPDKQNFPVRNRIVAGMCDVTVVVESAEKGGAVITAYLACSYNREVAAFPGRVKDKTSEGTHQLIKKQVAHLITGAEDLCLLMNWEQVKHSAMQAQLFPSLSEDEKTILRLILSSKAMHIDQLLLRSGCTPAALSGILLHLELQNYITQLRGKYYRATEKSAADHFTIK